MPPVIFSSATQRPTDPSAEDRWRPFTYLQYIQSVPEDVYSWSLSFVQSCRFAWCLPPGFEFFEGRVASLGIDRLGLEPVKVADLLHAVAGAGARVPGTTMKLRVARPWFALFEEAVGDEPLLPPHWLEGVELHGDPFSLWIGDSVPHSPICPNLLDPACESVRRARRQFAELDWSQYESAKYGWRLWSSPIPPSFFNCSEHS